MLNKLNFRKGVVRRFIHLFGFSKRKTFRMRQPILILLKTLNAQLPEPGNEPELVKLIKFIPIKEHAGNIRKMNAIFRIGAFLGASSLFKLSCLVVIGW